MGAAEDRYYMNLEDAAAYLGGVDPEKIREACRSGALKAAKIGKGWRLRSDRIDEWYDRLCEGEEWVSTGVPARKSGESVLGGTSIGARAQLYDLKP